MPTPRASLSSPRKSVVFACACLFAAGAHARVFPQGPQPQQLAGAATARGVELFRSGDNEAALKALREATKREKSNAEGWHYLGLALAKKGKLKDARKAFERAVELRPDFSDALTALAYLLVEQNETFEAARLAQKAVAVRPSNLEARYIVGVTQLRHSSNTGALEEAEAALKIDPSFAPALYLKVVALTGMSANAVSAATDETQDVREILLGKIGARLDEAEAALRRFAELEPRHAEIESLREQLKTLRLYGASFGTPAIGGDIMSAKEVTTRAQVLSRPEPLYTERARQHGTKGTVVLRMVLAADGVVRHIFVVRGLPNGLTENAVNAARRLKFIPATKDGRRVSQFVTIQYNFNIY